MSCVRQLEEVKSSDYCQYVRPPIDRYKTLQFGSFNEIMEVGYVHGRTLFAGMKAGQHTLRSVLNLDGTSTVQVRQLFFCGCVHWSHWKSSGPKASCGYRHFVSYVFYLFL